MEARAQLSGIGSLLPPSCGFWGSESGQTQITRLERQAPSLPVGSRRHLEPQASLLMAAGGLTLDREATCFCDSPQTPFLVCAAVSKLLNFFEFSYLS